MRTYHTHFGVPLGNTPGWWDDRKEINSLCCLSTFPWTFPATSAAHFLAFAFLATTFWSKECVMTGIEGLMSSGYVTDVAGTIFMMRNTFCRTVRWTSGQTSHTATAYLPTSVWGWSSSFEDIYGPTWYFWCCLFCSLVPSPVPLIFLAFFWFGYRLFSKASAQMPTRGIYSDVTLPYLMSRLAVALPDWRPFFVIIVTNRATLHLLSLLFVGVLSSLLYMDIYQVHAERT